jgi:ABC-2 type transport system ATP-binding protein
MWGAGGALQSRVGYLPELFRYQPWLTSAEVLALHVRLAGVETSSQERRECLGVVGLADRADDRVGGFSKGMQQRLGLAVALVARPELVVLDEPTSALDPVGRADVRDLLLSLKARAVAVLLNSHLIGEVERVCDRVVVLDKGRVAASGTLAELPGRRELRLRVGLGTRVHAVEPGRISLEERRLGRPRPRARARGGGLPSPRPVNGNRRRQR